MSRVPGSLHGEGEQEVRRCVRVTGACDAADDLYSARHTPAALPASALRTRPRALWGVRWLSGEGIGLVIRRLPVRFPAVPNDGVSLGKELHPTCLVGNVPVLTVSSSG